MEQEAGEVKDEAQAPEANTDIQPEGPAQEAAAAPAVEVGEAPAALPASDPEPTPDPDTRTSAQHHPQPDEGASVPNHALDAPAAAAGTETDMTTKPDFTHGVDGMVVLVIKGAEKIPVQVKDEAHYNQLVATHGAEHVQILPKGAL